MEYTFFLCNGIHVFLVYYLLLTFQHSFFIPRGMVYRMLEMECYWMYNVAEVFVT